MARYAIGDVQGCDRTLGRLLERIRFDPGRDELWLAGDLVNRGPRSLEVLRRVRALGEAATAVLGNHDLHLLARAAGVRTERPRDTLEPILAAPDRDALLEWLAARPLLVREGESVLVHAGLPPSWSADDARARAAELERDLRAGGETRARLLAAVQTEPAPRWDDHLDGDRRLATIAFALTRLRACTPDGRFATGFTGPPDACPEGTQPWFEVPGRRSADDVVVFGHWAALGLHLAEGVVGLDTGCVWGRQLTAVRLEDRAVFAEPLAD